MNPAAARHEKAGRASLVQRRAAAPESSVWVAASAGTGKTKVLTDRVLSLMLNGSPPGAHPLPDIHQGGGGRDGQPPGRPPGRLGGPRRRGRTVIAELARPARIVRPMRSSG